MDSIWHRWLIRTASNRQQAKALDITSSSRWLVWLLSVFVVVFLLWSCFLELDDTVSGYGKVTPFSKVQEVQSLDGGNLKSVFVAEGDFVRAGEPLLQVDETRFQSSFRVNESELEFLKGTAVRLDAELSLMVQQQDGSWLIKGNESVVIPETFLHEFPAQALSAKKMIEERVGALKSQMAVLSQQSLQKQQEMNELRAQIKILEKSLTLAREELALKAPLSADGVVTRVEIIALERQVNELQGEVGNAVLRTNRLRSALQEADNRSRELVARYRADIQKELQEVRERLGKLSEGQAGLEDRVQKTILYAPVDGMIKRISVHTEGSVIQPGATLVEIVPANDPLIIEARIQPADIAFLKPGQTAWVKLSAYEFSIYGSIQGQVGSISADTLNDENGQPYYRVRLNLPMTSHIGLLPGMTGMVDIVTGTRTVMKYLLIPLARGFKH
ncbi:HlyD family type I secretion periplasmic adaptor subunit [uncultured Endozoicomonas sp.]|uniref:HlyD family type I secretion periplasmic adaptor subunit n=1 Tax=uncultured Endozoicomonas sp. TaxID=432652 RepID=UPI002633E2CD|nr:HlyD family type I secretion periplasmic adaptor subunit [uncultured Endozoicomonas sp.]